MNKKQVAFWFRRDLRLEDNVGLYHALTSGCKVLLVFIFDTEILDSLPVKDPRVGFIHQTLSQLQLQLQAHGSSLCVRIGKPQDVWAELLQTHPLVAVYTNHDYEPYATQRDGAVGQLLATKNIEFHTFRDQVIFEKTEILSNQGKPYTVFTPYSRKWKAQLTPNRLQAYPSENHLAATRNFTEKLPSLKEVGFEEADIPIPTSSVNEEIISTYDQTRNFPAKKGTTRLGIHLRFGTLSIRRLASVAHSLNETYLNELIWREFYMQILWNFPHVVAGPFKKQYGAIPWREDAEGLQRWKDGTTGFPIVDAGMRELNATGYMHNRVRMIAASFLVKDLLINWQEGEQYFAEKLLDFELASNNGGWQWAAGCGTDAAPYFRVFNPASQLKKFDPELKYVRKWVPEFGTPAYPAPVVDHAEARKRVLEVFKTALDQER